MIVMTTPGQERNQLTLMTDAANSSGIGTGADATIDATLDLLDSTIRVSEVDHINEGVHRGINAMYQRIPSEAHKMPTFPIFILRLN